VFACGPSRFTCKIEDDAILVDIDQQLNDTHPASSGTGVELARTLASGDEDGRAQPAYRGYSVLLWAALVRTMYLMVGPVPGSRATPDIGKLVSLSPPEDVPG
jgi:hypothetical protein